MNHISTEKAQNFSLDRALFHPKTKEDECALYLAQALNDTNNFAFYRHITKQVPIDKLYYVLSIVLNIPDGKITKSKAAVFNGMIKKFRTN